MDETGITNIKEKLLKSLNIEKSGFYNPVFLQDIKVGFSIVKNPSDSLKEKLKIKDNKQYKTLVRVYIKDEDLLNTTIKKKTLIIKMHFNLVENDEMFRENYDFIKNNRYKPVDLISTDYSYNIDNNEFCDIKGQIVEGKDVLADVYKQHIKTSRLFVGFYLRLKLFFWQRFIPYIFSLLSNIFVCFLYIISGQKYTYDVIKRYVDLIYFKEDKVEKEEKENLKESKKITIFEYSASFWSIFVYCIFHLILYSIFYLNNYKPDYIKIMLSNNFLIIIYAVFSLSIFEVFLPKILKFLIKNLTKLSVNLSTKNVKI